MNVGANVCEFFFMRAEDMRFYANFLNAPRGNNFVHTHALCADSTVFFFFFVIQLGMLYYVIGEPLFIAKFFFVVEIILRYFFVCCFFAVLCS